MVELECDELSSASFIFIFLKTQSPCAIGLGIGLVTLGIAKLRLFKSNATQSFGRIQLQVVNNLYHLLSVQSSTHTLVVLLL